MYKLEVERNKPEQEEVPERAVDHWSMAHDDPIRAASVLDAIWF